MNILKQTGIKNHGKTRRMFVLAKCSYCGDEWELPESQAKRSKTGRCRKCHQTKHNQCNRGSVTREYSTWQGIKKRCYDKKNKHYADYGGRGITVCERWKNSFENFYEDMGNKPLNYSIDRIDNNGSYESSNCRWATQSEQTLNTRKRKGTKSKYRGVSSRKYGHRARVGVKGTIINIGSYKTEIEAARAYDRYILDNNLNNKRNFYNE